jgi:hypothetical protein
MSNLSELLPAGAGAKSASFVASGTLGSGVTVGLNSDGTVEVISQTAAVISSAVDVSGANGVKNSYYSTSSDWNPNTNKVIVGIINTAGGAGIIYCGTVSGTTISFGSGFNATNQPANVLDVKWDLNQSNIFVFVRCRAPYYFGELALGQVSGTTVTQVPSGANTTFASWDINIYTNPIRYANVVRNANTGKFVVFYAPPDNSYYGTSKVITMNGTNNPSKGSATVFKSATSTFFNSSDSNTNKAVLLFYDNVGSKCLVGSISGTSISFGAETTLETGYSYGGIAYSPTADKFLAAPKTSATSSGVCYLGAISGTSITFGSAFTYDSSGADYTKVNYNSGDGTFQIFYRAVNNSSYLKTVTASVSGTTVSLTAPYTIESNTTSQTAASYALSPNVFIAGYRSSTGRFEVKTYRPSATNSSSFIGITDQAIADTATGAVIVQGGVSEKVTGLTANTDYYVQADGTLSATVSSVPAGRALSTTSILLEG